MLNIYKTQLVNTFPNTCYNPNLWLVLTSVMGKTSNDIMNNNHQQMETNIIVLLYMIVKIAYVFDIDMDVAWEEWRQKATRKKYFTNYSSSYSSNCN